MPTSSRYYVQWERPIRCAQGDRIPFCVGAYYVRPRENAVLPYRIYVCHSEECNDEESLGEIKYNGYSCTDKTERLFAYAQSDR